MFFAWLKNYMPRSLYGRAALILISPVVTLQLVVSVVFIQRHFEGVTEQMSRGVALELRYLLDEMQGLPTQAGALNAVRDATESLNYDFSYVSDAQLPAQDLRRWYDFSGIVVVRSLNENLQELRRVEMPDDRHIFVYTDTKLGLLKIGFDRPRVSATNPHQLLVNMLFFGVLMTVISFFLPAQSIASHHPPRSCCRSFWSRADLALSCLWCGRSPSSRQCILSNARAD